MFLLLTHKLTLWNTLFAEERNECDFAFLRSIDHAV